MLFCLVFEQLLKVVYFGFEGIFIQVVVFKYFGNVVISMLMVVIDEVFCEVVVGVVNFGVVFVENFIEGVVNYIFDSFFEYDMVICGEVELCIYYYLLVGEIIKIDNIIWIYFYV